MSKSQQNQSPQSQTLVEQSENIKFETLEQNNGFATVIRFKVENETARAGDILLVLSGSDIQFHGFIGQIEDGWGIAMDRNGSALPAVVH